MVSGAGKGNAGPPRREYTDTPGSPPKLVSLCNTLNNPRTCRKWSFYSRRCCALIPTGGEWGPLGWWRPPSYEGRRGLALRHTSGRGCAAPLMCTSENSPSTSVGDHCRFIAVPKLAGNKANTKAQSERAEALAEVFKK